MLAKISISLNFSNRSTVTNKMMIMEQKNNNETVLNIPFVLNGIKNVYIVSKKHLFKQSFLIFRKNHRYFC